MLPVRRNGAGRSLANGVVHDSSSPAVVDEGSLLELQLGSLVAGSETLVSVASVTSLQSEHEETLGATLDTVDASGNVLPGSADVGAAVPCDVELPAEELFEWSVGRELDGMSDGKLVVVEGSAPSADGAGVQRMVPAARRTAQCGFMPVDARFAFRDRGELQFRTCRKLNGGVAFRSQSRRYLRSAACAVSLFGSCSSKRSKVWIAP